jgi:hypothetical protein
MGMRSPDRLLPNFVAVLRVIMRGGVVSAQLILSKKRHRRPEGLQSEIANAIPLQLTRHQLGSWRRAFFLRSHDQDVDRGLL